MFVISYFCYFGCATQKAVVPVTPRAVVPVTPRPVVPVTPAPASAVDPTLAPKPIVTSDGLIGFTHLGIKINALDWQVKLHKQRVVPADEPALMLIKGPGLISLQFVEHGSPDLLLLRELKAVEGKVPGVDYSSITDGDGAIVGFSIKSIRDGVPVTATRIVVKLIGSDTVVIAGLVIPGQYLNGAMQELDFILTSIRPL